MGRQANHLTFTCSLSLPSFTSNFSSTSHSPGKVLSVFSTTCHSTQWLPVKLYAQTSLLLISKVKLQELRGPFPFSINAGYVINSNLSGNTKLSDDV